MAKNSKDRAQKTKAAATAPEAASSETEEEVPVTEPSLVPVVGWTTDVLSAVEESKSEEVRKTMEELAKANKATEQLSEDDYRDRIMEIVGQPATKWTPTKSDMQTYCRALSVDPHGDVTSRLVSFLERVDDVIDENGLRQQLKDSTMLRTFVKVVAARVTPSYLRDRVEEQMKTVPANDLVAFADILREQLDRTHDADMVNQQRNNYGSKRGREEDDQGRRITKHAKKANQAVRDQREFVKLRDILVEQQGRPALASAADLALVPTTPLARTGTDGRESDAETLERYSIPVPAPGYTSLVQEGYGGTVSGTPTGTPTWNGPGVPENTIVATITVATGGIRDIQKAYEEFTRGIEEQQRTASLLFFQQANEDCARSLGVQESQLVEMAEGLLRAAETHESRRQDEFQKALTNLRDCYTRELDVAWAQNTLSWEDRTRELEQQLALKWEQREALLVRRDKDSDLLVARRLHEEVLSRVQKDAERVLEVRRREDHLRHDGLMSSLREELRTLKRNHQEEILLVREAARDEDTSKGVAYDLLQSQYDRDLASARDEVQSKASELESVQEALRATLRESANVACGNCQILEKEKRDLREALRERERSLEEEVQRRQRMERIWEEEHWRLRESEETVRELQESILTEQNRYDQILLSEHGRRQDLEQLVQEQFMTLTQERAHSGEDPSPETRDQLERERHANEEVLRQVEEARSCLETEKLQLRDQEATLFRERSVQDLTLSRAYAELERQLVQLQVEQRAVDLQQRTPQKTNNAPYATYGIPTLSRMGSPSKGSGITHTTFTTAPLLPATRSN
ncbi:hypothetical protein DYB28_003644, partial [Aphanomyces astaci]